MRAVEEAEANHSPVARASAYWNASLIESRNGAHGAALDLARKALAAFEIGEDGRNVARLRTQIAKMQLMVDPPDPEGAIQTLEVASRELAWSSTSTVDRASEHLTRAQAQLMLGELDEAADSVGRALALLPDDAIVSRASALALEGQIAVARQRVDDARELFRGAVQALSGIGADREAAQLWFELGGLLSEVGETEAAMDAFRRAAASTGLTGSSARVGAPTS
jgi:tetratricopeptide (TPR) repeat protein